MEMASPIRHEYVNGQVFAMSGASKSHNRICLNLSGLIEEHLDGTSCSVYVVDLKLRIEKADCFYYPDLMVTCEPFDADQYVITEPVLIIEVLSPSTRQTDLREKLAAYKSIHTVKQYVIIYQDRMRIELHQRVNQEQWDAIILHRLANLELTCCPGKSLNIPVERIYKGLDLPPVVREEEGEYEIV
jgi:Uma2 family endonuclease